ncbi:MAG: cytochrome b N-terminal domain-containing protein [Thiohalomonadales bacterium]
MTEPSKNSKTKDTQPGHEPSQIKPSFWEERFKVSAFLYPIPRQANTLTYSLGGVTFFAFLVLIASGIILAQFYDPRLATAHQSIDYIMREATLGWFVRGIHYWSAQLLFVLLLLHMSRVIITAAYKRPREFTYYFGLILFLLMTVMVMTGTALKWDQEGFEALEHFTAIGTFLGNPADFFSTEFTDNTELLTRIFSLHTSVLPLLLVLVLAVHIYLVKALKISPHPMQTDQEQDHGEAGETFGGHMIILLKLGFGFLAIVTILALFVSPPLGPEPMPGESGVRPWWMFLWMYYVENQVGSVSGAVYAGAIIGLSLAAIPLLDRGTERNPFKRPIMIPVLILYIAVIAMSFGGYFGEAALHFQG